jgi:hypothetical protein
MTCKRCHSDAQASFGTEMNIHFPGWEGLTKQSVLVFPEVLVCLKCGFAEFEIKRRELDSLADGRCAAEASRLKPSRWNSL